MMRNFRSRAKMVFQASSQSYARIQADLGRLRENIMTLERDPAIRASLTGAQTLLEQINESFRNTEEELRRFREHDFVNACSLVLNDVASMARLSQAKFSAALVLLVCLITLYYTSVDKTKFYSILGSGVVFLGYLLKRRHDNYHIEFRNHASRLNRFGQRLDVLQQGETDQIRAVTSTCENSLTVARQMHSPNVTENEIKEGVIRTYELDAHCSQSSCTNLTMLLALIAMLATGLAWKWVDAFFTYKEVSLMYSSQYRTEANAIDINGAPASIGFGM